MYEVYSVYIIIQHTVKCLYAFICFITMLNVRIYIGSPYNRPLEAQRVSRGIAVPFHDLDGGELSAPRPGRFIPGKDRVPIV